MNLEWSLVDSLFNVCVCVFRFCEEDIDLILERRAHVIQLESEGKGSTFSKVRCHVTYHVISRDMSLIAMQASFAADGSSDINVDDPDFWQKWAEKANLDLDELANKVSPGRGGKEREGRGK